MDLNIRLGGGRKRSSSEKVLAVGEHVVPIGGCGLFILMIDGLRIPSLVKIVRC